MKPIVNRKYRIIDESEGKNWKNLEFRVLSIGEPRLDIDQYVYEVKIQIIKSGRSVMIPGDVIHSLLDFKTFKLLKASKLPGWF